ncbi:hypothetical protein VNI00_017390 [Paramarasmius palmivorus]|uniref:Uncharacterized protein n=1 Tax=Paramarasmius palmivorus TaxID=297713 RepID=A0AAW0B5L2_9AGAR
MSATSTSVSATSVDAACPVDGCSIPIDLIIESSDGNRLGAHTKNLEMFNTAFPLTTSVTHDTNDVVKLSEKNTVLVLLLQFSHYQEHEDLCGKGLDLVLDLAAAAEKYGNHFAAMAAREAINYYAKLSSDNAIRVIPYKATHSDLKGMDEIVRSTMDLPLLTALQCMKSYPEVFYAYALFREKYKASRDSRNHLDWESCERYAADPWYSRNIL